MSFTDSDVWRGAYTKKEITELCEYAKAKAFKNLNKGDGMDGNQNKTNERKAGTSRESEERIE